MQQVTVRRMDLDHAKTAVDRTLRCHAECLDDRGDSCRIERVGLRIIFRIGKRGGGHRQPTALADLDLGRV